MTDGCKNEYDMRTRKKNEQIKDRNYGKQKKAMQKQKQISLKPLCQSVSAACFCIDADGIITEKRQPKNETIDDESLFIPVLLLVFVFVLRYADSLISLIFGKTSEKWFTVYHIKIRMLIFTYLTNFHRHKLVYF